MSKFRKEKSMFNITLKKCNCENYRLTKTFDSGSTSTTFHFKGEQSVLNPVILIGSSENLTVYNYAEIPDFNRKYFITDIRAVRENLYEITLHVDVLATYDTQIRSVKADVRRQENNFNTYLDDPEFHIYNNAFIQVQKFSGSDFTKDLKYVLVTAGG
jgi:hypothetical protein